MTEKKERGIVVWAAIAMVECCLLLIILLTGGGLAITEGYFNNSWIVYVGFAIIIITILAFIWNRKMNAD